MTKRTEQALFPAPHPLGKRPSPGPVYQGVCKEIRHLSDAEPSIKDAHAGTIAQARSLAASIDRVSGHDGPQASGHQLALMHQQLDALLNRLNPTTPSDPDDPFDTLLEQLAHNDGSTSSPHPPV